MGLLLTSDRARKTWHHVTLWSSKSRAEGMQENYRELQFTSAIYSYAGEVQETPTVLTQIWEVAADP